MKKVLLLILMMSCLSLYSQTKGERFTILKIGKKYSTETIIAAFNKADMCGNFYISKPNDIVLDDGAIVRFFSKKETDNTGDISNDCFVSDNTTFPLFLWSILPNGAIAKGYTPAPTKSFITE